MPNSVDEGLINSIQEGVGGAIGYFINFGSEISIMEDVLLTIIVPFVGILISASAVLDLTKMRNPRHQNKTSPTSVAVRFVIGPATVQLVIFVKAIAGSIFGDEMVNEASMSSLSYTEKVQETDPTAGLLLTLVGFLIFVGWISALRSMIAFSRIGNPQENGFQMFKAGASRLVAATFLCMFQFVMDDIIASFSGESGVFSSQLNL